MSKRDRIKEQRRKAKKSEQLALLKETQVERQERPLTDPVDQELQKQIASLQQDELEEEMGAESVQKDMTEMAMPMPGPTSWDELDEQELAYEKAEMVQEATWDVRKLVSNILWHPEMNADQKSSAIAAVGQGFGPRVNAILEGSDVISKEVDMDLLAAEALLAQDERNTPITEKVFDIIKRTLSYGARKNLAAGDFALPEERAYPIHDKAHVRNALARAAQQMKAGGSGAERAKKAMPKIRAAAKKMGIESSMEKEHNAIVIEKDAAGDYRWVGWVSNNFEDRSGDILTDGAHLEYVDWVNKDLGQRAPVFTSCHAPGTAREHAVDFVGYQNGFLVMSGKLNDGEAQALMTVSKEVELGMSHTAWGLRDQSDPRLITKYRIFEVTDLPVSQADNPFTTLETISKEADMDQLEYLTKLLGSKERAQTVLAEKTKLAQKELQEAGVESKEVQPPVENKASTPAAAPTPPTVNVSVDADALMKQIEDKLGMGQLSETIAEMRKELEKIPVLEELVKTLSKSADDTLAETLTPPASRYVWMSKSRPSQSEETVVKEEDPIAKAKPSTHWLEEVAVAK